MLPHATAEPGPAFVTDLHVSEPDGCQADAGIFSALLDALNGSGTFRLVDRSGELFLEHAVGGWSGQARP